MKKSCLSCFRFLLLLLATVVVSSPTWAAQGAATPLGAFSSSWMALPVPLVAATGPIADLPLCEGNVLADRAIFQCWTSMAKTSPSPSMVLADLDLRRGTAGRQPGNPYERLGLDICKDGNLCRFGFRPDLLRRTTGRRLTNSSNERLRPDARLLAQDGDCEILDTRGYARCIESLRAINNICSGEPKMKNANAMINPISVSDSLTRIATGEWSRPASVC